MLNKIVTCLPENKILTIYTDHPVYIPLALNALFYILEHQ